MKRMRFPAFFMSPAVVIILLITVTAILSVAATPADTKIPDLEQALQNASDVEKIPLHLELFNDLQGEHPEMAIDHARQALALLQIHSDQHLEVTTLNDLGARLMSTGDFEGALECTAKSLVLAEQIGRLDELCEAHILTGTTYGKMGDFPEALSHGAEARRLGNTFDDQQDLSRALNLLAVLRRQIGDYDEAITLNFQALKIEEAAGRKRGMARSTNNLGVVCYTVEDYPRSLKYYREALELYRELENERQIARALNNIGLVHFSLKEYDKALPYLEQALASKEELGDSYSVSSTLSNLGNLYLKKEQPDNALEFFGRALEIHIDLGNRFGQTNVAVNIGLAYMAQEQYRSAGKELENALEMAEELGMKKQVSTSLEQLSKAHEALGDPEKALAYLKRHKKVNDELFSGEHGASVAELEMRHEAEKHQREVELLRETNLMQAQAVQRDRLIRNSFLAGATVFLLLLLVVSRLYRGSRKANAKLETAHQDLQTVNIELRQQRDELEVAVKQINTLSGLLPICARCKNIRDDAGYWQRIEVYVQQNSDTEFTHSICPDCAKKLYGKSFFDAMEATPAPRPPKSKKASS